MSESWFRVGNILDFYLVLPKSKERTDYWDSVKRVWEACTGQSIACTGII